MENTKSFTTQDQPSNVVAEANDQATPGTLDTILVTYDTSVKLKDHITSRKPLSWVINEIRTSQSLRDHISTIRSTQADKERRELKANLLPYFTFLEFANGIRQSQFFKSVSYMLMDLDHLEEKIESLKEQMRVAPDVFMFFVSPSGDGLRLCLPLIVRFSRKPNTRARTSTSGNSSGIDTEWRRMISRT